MTPAVRTGWTTHMYTHVPYFFSPVRSKMLRRFHPKLVDRAEVDSNNVGQNLQHKVVPKNAGRQTVLATGHMSLCNSCHSYNTDALPIQPPQVLHAQAFFGHARTGWTPCWPVQGLDRKHKTRYTRTTTPRGHHATL
jgi:hypothetical protein